MADNDKCSVCGKESDVGIHGVNGGDAFNLYLCEEHYYHYKMRTDEAPAAQPKKKLSKEERTLQRKGFRTDSKNGGLQLVVSRKSRPYRTTDYWPTTGIFIARESRIRGKGLDQMVQMLKQDL